MDKKIEDFEMADSVQSGDVLLLQRGQEYFKLHVDKIINRAVLEITPEIFLQAVSGEVTILNDSDYPGKYPEVGEITIRTNDLPFLQSGSINFNELQIYHNDGPLWKKITTNNLLNHNFPNRVYVIDQEVGKPLNPYYIKAYGNEESSIKFYIDCTGTFTINPDWRAWIELDYKLRG
jgi:hypothetical protein